ncbi:MAG: hypothetical protein ACKPGB_09815, partial [Dolichospermum sp.]
MTNNTDTQTNQTTNKARILKIAAILGTVGIICGIGVVVTLISPAFFPHQEVKATTLTIGILSSPKYYQGLATYLKQQFGNKVQIVIDGDENLSYEEARKRMINKEWDITFPQSPMLSIAAKNNGYSFA